MRTLKTLVIPLALLALHPAPARADELPSFDATHCELYVNSFGIAELSYQGVAEKALDAELILDEAQLTHSPNVRIVRAGAGLTMRVITAERDAAGQPTLTIDEHRQIAIGEQGFGAKWRVYFTFERLSLPQTIFEEVLDFAFFVDVLREDGETVRLWQRDRGGSYTLPGVFGSLPGSDLSLGSGIIHYPEPSSVIYDFKRACAGTPPS